MVERKPPKRTHHHVKQKVEIHKLAVRGAAATFYFLLPHRLVTDRQSSIVNRQPTTIDHLETRD